MLTVMTHSFPTLRPSDLLCAGIYIGRVARRGIVSSLPRLNIRHRESVPTLLLPCWALNEYGESRTASKRASVSACSSRLTREQPVPARDNDCADRKSTRLNSSH